MGNDKITIEECRKCIGDTNLPDETVAEIRDAIYALTESVFDKYECE
ncbi:MAG: hypothetical protein NT098_06025 [Candidatus Parcubacteria bacterium]|nr:hypothetical protein [Candidatus Parcubacteria bacterium]